jgi:hypothetical protein
VACPPSTVSSSSSDVARWWGDGAHC